MINVRRAYAAPLGADGTRVLVDHLWPRGLKKEELKLRSWEKAVAPSTSLRKWFGHDPGRWEEFQRRYFSELDKNPGAWAPLLAAARRGDITLVYGARDTEHNNAVALKRYLEERLGTQGRRAKSAVLVR